MKTIIIKYKDGDDQKLLQAIIDYTGEGTSLEISGDFRLTKKPLIIPSGNGTITVRDCDFTTTTLNPFIEGNTATTSN